MVKITNTQIYGLEESLVASGFSYLKEFYTEEEYDEEVNKVKEHLKSLSELNENKHCKRLMKHGSVAPGSGHDSALKGISVHFNLTYPQYFTPQLQRYNWADIVSSQSKMHSLLGMKIDANCNKYVTAQTIDQMNSLIADYNICIHESPNDKRKIYESFMKVLSNCPLGFELSERVSTNYLQLKTIYYQRKKHKLEDDWGYFCDWILNLPYFKELCLGG